MTLEQISSNLFTLIGVPIIIYTKHDNKKFFQDFTMPTQLKLIIDDSRTLIKKSTIDYSVYRLKDVTELSYFSFKVLESTIIIGPYLEADVKPETVSSLSKQLKFISSEQTQVKLFYNSLVVLDDDKLDFIYHMISNITHSKYNSPIFKKIRSVKIDPITNINPEDSIVQIEYIEQNYKVENQFIDIIEQGDVEEAKKFKVYEIMKQLPKNSQHDSLMKTKTNLTILNTLCNRAAIHGGIDLHLAHQISINFTITIKAINSTLDSDQLSLDIIIGYAEAVKTHTLHNHSKLIRKAILEIRKHLTSNYGLSDLADDLEVSKEHLARTFKKETSLTVSTYIGHVKVIEAKKMLEHSDFSVSDISDALGFSNSTYFTKIFKKHSSISPKQYKNQKQILNKY